MPAAPIEDSTFEPEHDSDTPLRALMVDDDEIQLQVTGNHLAKAGFKVLFATTGSRALQLFRSHDFHVAIVDLHLEDVSGVELIRYLRESPNGPTVRIVAWTASNDSKLLEAALLAGANDVYLKSMPSDVIAAKFRQLAASSASDARRDGEIASLRADVNLMMAMQAKLVESVDGLRVDMRPLPSLIQDWEEQQRRRRAVREAFLFVRRWWLRVVAIATGIGALVALFPGVKK